MRPNYDINTDYFAILGVHYGACTKTVKLAYRKMARRYHPDVSRIHDAQSRFQEIALAYEILNKYREAYCREYDLRQIQHRPKQKVKPRARQQTNNKTSSADSSSTSSQGSHQSYQQSQQKSENASQTNSQEKAQSRSQKQTHQAYRSAFREQKPINGKDRVITYPITLRYAIRLLNLGQFYIPGLKVQMKFTRKAFENKTFRLEGKGYSGLFGGKSGDYLVKFNIKIDSSRYKLKEGDIYSTFGLPQVILQPGKKVSLDTVSGKVEIDIPQNYSSEKFIKIAGRGLPADENTPAGDLYARLIVN